jgi:putative flavoprotein involved in K+ transport
VGRAPRRYRGKDANLWQHEMGAYERTVDQLPSPQEKFAAKPQISGKDGGHTLNLHQFARDGIVLLGRAQGVRGDQLILAPDLKENLAKADKFEAAFVKAVDDFIATNNLDAPKETLPEPRHGYESADPPELNLREANISSVIWATGYKFDFSLVRFPVLDGDGYPVQQRGVTAFPGLYFVGLPWLHNAKSGLLLGLEEDAAHVAATIVERSSLPGLVPSHTSPDLTSSASRRIPKIRPSSAHSDTRKSSPRHRQRSHDPRTPGSKAGVRRENSVRQLSPSLSLD